MRVLLTCQISNRLDGPDLGRHFRWDAAVDHHAVIGMLFVDHDALFVDFGDQIAPFIWHEHMDGLHCDGQ